MTEIRKKEIEYTLVTQAVESIIPSRNVITLCEKMSEGLISADAAVSAVLNAHGIKRVVKHG